MAIGRVARRLASRQHARLRGLRGRPRRLGGHRIDSARDSSARAPMAGGSAAVDARAGRGRAGLCDVGCSTRLARPEQT